MTVTKDSDEELEDPNALRTHVMATWIDENCVVHGDEQNVNLLSKIIGAPLPVGERNINLDILYGCG